MKLVTTKNLLNITLKTIQQTPSLNLNISSHLDRKVLKQEMQVQGRRSEAESPKAAQENPAPRCGWAPP